MRLELTERLSNLNQCLALNDWEPFVNTDEVEWDEPYKDGGSEVAHQQLRDQRLAS
jgi:hypothetical protein